MSKYYLPKKRSNVDLCFYGDKGSGKTMAMVSLAVLEGLRGREIFANFKCNFPYTHVFGLDEIESMSNCLFLADDFENWCSSKYIPTAKQRDVLMASTNFGKRSIDFLWSCKAPMEINKTLRLTIDYFVKSNFYLKEIPVTYEEYEDWSGYTDAHKIVLECYNKITLECDRLVEIDDTDLWAALYNTSEEVARPKVQVVSNKGGWVKKIPKGFFGTQKNPSEAKWWV